MAINEKRAYFRQTLHAEAWIAGVGGEQWTRIDLLDISVGGIAFILREQLRAGSSCMLRFFLPDHPQRISLTAQVMHCARHTFLEGYRIGAQITEIDAADLNRIAHFIEQASGHQA